MADLGAIFACCLVVGLVGVSAGGLVVGLVGVSIGGLVGMRAGFFGATH